MMFEHCYVAMCFKDMSFWALVVSEIHKNEQQWYFRHNYCTCANTVIVMKDAMFLDSNFYWKGRLMFYLSREFIIPSTGTDLQWWFATSDVKQYANLVKTLVFLLQTWKPKEIGVKDQSSGSSSNTDGALQVGDHLGLNTREETQIGKRNNVVTVPLSLPKPCFLMSWRRRIPKEDEDLFFQGCKGAGLCVADYGARVYCIYPHQRVD